MALRRVEDQIFGIMSSHPAACIATAKAYAGELTAFCSTLLYLSPPLLTQVTRLLLSALPLGFMQTCARDIMAGSPIAYVQNAEQHLTP
jgi:predicted Co/Zn/Cd cation transporter (cation efflux family)